MWSDSCRSCSLQSTFWAQPELPDLSAATFRNSLQIDNPYSPLVPGTTRTYESQNTDPETGVKDTETIIIDVLNDTRTILGVETRGVRDRVFFEGLLSEDIVDWYAQDDAGNVWFMGEDATNYERDAAGNVIEILHDGAWEAGVDGALPGYIMKANPMVGENYYEWLLTGEAEDEVTIVSVGQSVTVRGVTFDNMLEIQDSSVLSTGTTTKYYALGIGDVLALDFDLDVDGELVPVGRTELIPEPSGLWSFVLGSLVWALCRRCSRRR